MRLIDSDDLRQVLDVFSEKDSLGHTPIQLCDAMPTIDAVEVVRCKDCKFYYDNDDCICIGTEPDWFCADGEVKNDATN